MTARQDILTAMPGTVEQLMHRTGKARTTTFNRLGMLKAEKAIHISDWERSKSGHAIAVYSPGNGEDAPMPVKPPPSRRASRAKPPAHAPTICAIGTIPAALLAQRKTFPLAGVWA